MRQEFEVRTHDNVSLVTDYIKTHIQAGGFPLNVLITKLRKKRSLSQNAALFGHAYRIISADTGNSVNDIHFQMCGEYFGWAIKHFNNKTYRLPVRTTTTNEEGREDKINITDFIRLFDFVQSWAMLELNINIPDPDSTWRNKIDTQEREK